MRIMPNIEKNKKLVSFGETILGKFLQVIIFSILILPQFELNDFFCKYTVVISIILITTYHTHLKRLMITLGTIFLSLKSDIPGLFLDLIFNKQTFIEKTDFKFYLFTTICMTISYVIGITFYKLSIKYKNKLFFKYPVLGYILFISSILVLLFNLNNRGIAYYFIWGCLNYLIIQFAYIAILLSNRTLKLEASTFKLIGTINPFWGGGTMPIPNGEHYLSKIEKSKSKDLSILRLRAIKLAIWLNIIMLIRGFIMTYFFHQNTIILQALNKLNLNVFPINLSFEKIFYDITLNIDKSLWVLWLSVFLKWSFRFLTYAVVGHLIISIVRFCGFDAKLNTNNPFKSRNFLDYYNRYHYYFKKFLFDVFFYPALFNKYTKSKKWLRILIALIYTTFIGNAFFHMILIYPQKFFTNGHYDYFTSPHVVTSLFYCFTLTLILYIKMILTKRNQLGKAKEIFGIISMWLIILTLEVFANYESHFRINEYLNFTRKLYGL